MPYRSDILRKVGSEALCVRTYRSRRHTGIKNESCVNRRGALNADWYSFGRGPWLDAKPPKAFSAEALHQGQEPTDRG